tara:strand:+ start:461 stop:844 length:384 start_codon:yes stop_codon:yes gene_type:complete
MFNKHLIKLTIVYFGVLLISSCTNDSISDLTTSTTEQEGLTLYDLVWQNSSISTNQELNIKVGDTVRWTWGSGTHNLRSTSGVESFDSGYHSSSGYQFMYEFTEIGSTEYVCDPHPNSMFGSITVSE